MTNPSKPIIDVEMVEVVNQENIEDAMPEVWDREGDESVSDQTDTLESDVSVQDVHSLREVGDEETPAGES